jgi:hypothetical protein
MWPRGNCWWMCAAALAVGALAQAARAADPQRVRLTTVDVATGAPLPARVYVHGADGAWHFVTSDAPDGTAVRYQKQRFDTSIEMHTTVSAHPCVVDLPPGDYTLTVERGPEYFSESRPIQVADAPLDLQVGLRRWIDMAERGWFSGDTHVHRALDELPNVMLAEDLNVAFPLVYWVTEAFASPATSEHSIAIADGSADKPPTPIAVDATHLIYPRNTEYELFTVNGQPHTQGAFFVIGHQSVLELGAPPVRPIAELAHAEGALIELDKHNWPWSMMLVPVMGVDLYELSNNHVWRTEFGFREFGEGLPDYMHIQRGEAGYSEAAWVEFGFQNYYALLNCGFRLRPTAGTASGVHPVPLGFSRVYVETGPEFSYQRWLAGLDAGRAFVTTGPMLMVQVNGQPAGHTFEQAQGTTAMYEVSGTIHSAQPLSRIEVLVNGQVVSSPVPRNAADPSGGRVTPIAEQIPLDETSWIAVRCFESRPDGRERFAHSAPVHIDVAGAPLRPRRAEVEYLIARVRAQLERNTGLLPEPALEEYRQALRIYEEIAQTAR